jgi:hypothetical protein
MVEEIKTTAPTASIAPSVAPKVPAIRQNTPIDVSPVTPPKAVLDMEFGGDMDDGDATTVTAGDGITNVVGDHTIAPDKTVIKTEKPGEVTKDRVTPAVKSPKKAVEEPVVVEEVPVKDEDVKGKSLLEVLKGNKGGKTTVPAQRDLSIFDAEESAAARQMSNEAFKQFTKLKLAAKQSDQLYYQSPDAYQLHPEYKTIQTDQLYADKETRYWADQLDKIKRGEPWRELKQWDANGNPVVGDEVAGTAAHEEIIRRQVYSLMDVSKQLKSKSDQFKQKYSQSFNQDLSAINAERTKRFAWVANPALQESTLDFGEFGVKTVKQVRGDFINMFPSYMRNHPAVDTAADLFVAMQVQGRLLAEAQKTKSVETTINQEEDHVEPGSTDKPKKPTGGKGIPAEFSLAGMEV